MLGVSFDLITSHNILFAKVKNIANYTKRKKTYHFPI
jgi:hypothetical protein